MRPSHLVDVIMLSVLLAIALINSAVHATDTITILADNDGKSTSPLSTTKNSEAPLEFPEPDENYIFKNNSTIRENLASHSVSASVESMMRKINKSKEWQFVTLANPDDKKLVVPDESQVGFKSYVEEIQNGENTKDAFLIAKMHAIAQSTVMEGEKEEENRPYPLFKGQVAGILAATFLLMSVLAYVALLSWRRMKYGSREMLVNEEDFVISHDDLKNFSI